MSPLPPAVRRPRARALTLLASTIALAPIVAPRTLTAQPRAVATTAPRARVPDAAGAPANEAHDSASDTASQRAAIARALGAARRQQRGGQAMVLAGVAGVVGSSAAWVRTGRMGMSGGQAALFTGSTGVVVTGAARWIAGRARGERARAARPLADAAGR